MREMRRVRSQNGHAHRQDDDVQHMAMAPIRVPLVGVMPFTSAQAPLSTHTMISGTRPRFWARGPMMGMDTVARPEEEGMSTDSSRYTT